MILIRVKNSPFNKVDISFWVISRFPDGVARGQEMGEYQFE